MMIQFCDEREKMVGAKERSGERAIWDIEGGKIEKKALEKRDEWGGCTGERQK